MENKEVANNQAQPPSSNPNQTPPLNPNRQTTLPENYSGFLQKNNSRFLPENNSGIGFLPENNSVFLPENYPGTGFFPENNSGFYRENYSDIGFLPENNSCFLPENYPGFGFLPENNQLPTSYPPFNPSRLNPSNQLKPIGYDWDSASLDEYFDRLNLSTPRHQSVGPTESVLRSRAQSAARGQNGNLYNGLYPQELGFGYEDDPNMFMGRPESVYGFNHRVNGPSLNQNSLFKEHMYASNGLNASNGLYRNNRESGPSSNRDGLLLDPLYWNSRPNQSRSAPTRTDWVGPSTNLSGLYRDPMYTSNNGYNRDQNGFFSKSMHGRNRPNGSQLFSSRPRPNKDQPRPIHQELSWDGPMSGRATRANNGPGMEFDNFISVKDLRGEIKLTATNKDGSAFLKKKIEEGVEEDSELIFEEVKDEVAGLMVNYFGSTVVQELFKVCGPEQIGYVVNLLLRDKYQFAEICSDNHGTLAMEKLFQNLRTPRQRNSVISFLRGLVLNLSKDQNGHKVVQYCINHFPESVDILINELVENCYDFAKHKSGCVVLQECLGRAAGETMERLMAELGPNVLILAEHPYGNYVVQYLIEKKNPSITKIILSWLAGNFVSLSIHKCSSNVVEKCLTFTREDEATEIIAELMNSDNFKMVIQDMYGNYVVQKALEVSQNMRQSDIHARLENRIMSLYGSLNSHPFGNRVLSKLNHRPKLN